MGKNLPDHSESVLTAMASHGLYTDGCDLVRWVFHPCGRKQVAGKHGAVSTVTCLRKKSKLSGILFSDTDCQSSLEEAWE